MGRRLYRGNGRVSFGWCYLIYLSFIILPDFTDDLDNIIEAFCRRGEEYLPVL